MDVVLHHYHKVLRGTSPPTSPPSFPSAPPHHPGFRLSSPPYAAGRFRTVPSPPSPAQISYYDACVGRVFYSLPRHTCLCCSSSPTSIASARPGAGMGKEGRMMQHISRTRRNKSAPADVAHGEAVWSVCIHTRLRLPASLSKRYINKKSGARIHIHIQSLRA